MILGVIVLVLIIAGIWKIFEKADQPGWAVFIPIYNLIVMLQITKKPIWWVVLFIIPIINVVISFIVLLELAKVFGKGLEFGVGLFFLGFIFFPILGFSDAKYQG